ncbi:MAG: DegT/DnrJ/EryC1/StrS aminotransferase family protein, partial [Chloroflexi bacterium]|nr:DegT/DnrJ/EryC1/StrS aminotransferase family protein [Chloroflexota bacterium]
MSSIPLVDLKAQYAAIQPDIDAAIARVITNTAFISGPAVAEFEAAWAAFQRAPVAVGCGSGTAALVLALQALDIGPGDEVITTAHTFIAT